MKCFLTLILTSRQNEIILRFLLSSLSTDYLITPLIIRFKLRDNEKLNDRQKHGVIKVF